MTITFRLDDEAAVHANLEILAEHGELPPDSLLVLLGDADSRVIMAVAVDDLPADPPQDERVRILAPFLRRLREDIDVDGVALVIARRGTTQVGGGDLGWYDAFTGCAGTARLSCHGVYLATPSGVRHVRPGSSEAA
ncbi:hypothetical protein CLV30_111135 [Haloactinopolyspora alba]|uniref:Uncharacterized protein n=1 Tax=Haloactinopolyspora alba TaxID=648780 RepID=A0A2P8DY72_9ACTN|nr:hypothetical protein [Haloactinopolyspora alba]PSL02180.1 hypothetical protein CLV30_111135 [Haloactinopolyspora alba]